MTEKEMQELQPGDIVRHVGSGEGYVVAGNFGKDRIIVIRSYMISNPSEWLKVCKECNRPIE